MWWVLTSHKVAISTMIINLECNSRVGKNSRERKDCVSFTQYNFYIIWGNRCRIASISQIVLGRLKCRPMAQSRIFLAPRVGDLGRGAPFLPPCYLETLLSLPDISDPRPRVGNCVNFFSNGGGRGDTVPALWISEDKTVFRNSCNYSFSSLKGGYLNRCIGISFAQIWGEEQTKKLNSPKRSETNVE